MSVDPVLDEIVLRHAKKLDFTSVYTSLLRQFPESADKRRLYQDDFKRILAETGWDFKYFKGERFFRHTRVEGDREILFHFCPSHGMVELMTYAKRRRQKAVGGLPWSMLADVCRPQGSSDEDRPDYLHPHFNGERQFAELLAKSLELHQLLSDAILNDPGWP